MLAAELLDKLLCPRCQQGGLEESPDNPSEAAGEHALRCRVCEARYPIRFGTPVLLPQAAVTGVTGVDSVHGADATGALERMRRVQSVLHNQGFRPFAQKSWSALRTEVERRIPALRHGPHFSCPCCSGRESFLTYRGRPYALCPACGAKERDRLLFLVLSEVLTYLGTPPIVLHSAPEGIVRDLLSKRSAQYVSVDLTMGLSSYAGQLSAAADLTCLPFQSESFDLVVACHVLEHIADDRGAIREIRRVLKPGGIALLPVPVVHGGRTVEYGEPRLNEEMHVRAPGTDYFDRFEEVGFRVAVKRSSDYSPEHQVHSFHEPMDQGARSAPGGPHPLASEQYIPICLRPGGREYPFAWRH